jgi:hypothetical protein
MKITVKLPARDWAALLRVLPACVGCGQPAELRISGRLRCISCAAAIRRGTCETLPWADAVEAIRDAVNGEDLI